MPLTDFIYKEEATSDLLAQVLRQPVFVGSLNSLIRGIFMDTIVSLGPEGLEGHTQRVPAFNVGLFILLISKKLQRLESMKSERLWSRTTKVFLLTELLFKVIEKALFLSPFFLFKQKFNSSLIYLLSMGCLQREAHSVTFSNTIMGIQGMMFLLTEVRRLKKLGGSPTQTKHTGRRASDVNDQNGSGSPEAESPDRPIDSMFVTPSGSPSPKYEFSESSSPTFYRGHSMLREMASETPLTPGEAAFKEFDEAVNDPSMENELFLAKISLLKEILEREATWQELNSNFRTFCDDVSTAPTGSFGISLSGKTRLALERSNLYKAERRLEPSNFDVFWTLFPSQIDPVTQQTLDRLSPNAYWDPNTFLINSTDPARLGEPIGITSKMELVILWLGPGVLKQTSRIKEWPAAVARYYALNTKGRLLRFRIADLFEFSPVTIDYREIRNKTNAFLRPFWVLKSIPKERIAEGVAGLAPILSSSLEAMALTLSYIADSRIEGKLTRLRPLPVA